MMESSYNDSGGMMQQDLHQLLTFACVRKQHVVCIFVLLSNCDVSLSQALVEENNNLKQILKEAIIIFDDESKQEVSVECSRYKTHKKHM